MRVRELIEVLKTMPQDVAVTTPLKYGKGFTSFVKVQKRTMHYDRIDKEIVIIGEVGRF